MSTFVASKLQRDDVYARRRACNEEHGDEPFDDPVVQQELLFEKHDGSIVDRAGDLTFEYPYPSTIGTAIFFQGGFEAGEISFATAILQQSAAPVIFDIGANIGLHAVSWCKAVPRATCHAFEPVRGNRELLERNIERNALGQRITVVPVALGEAVGEALFYECDDAAYSSLREVSHRKIISTYDVEVLTVDEYAARNGIAAIDLLKIDVEGYEMEVLAGASSVIERFHPHIFVEISAKNKNEDPERTIRRLIDAGYRAKVINDGIITPYEYHDDRFYNYFFVHSTRKVEIPQMDPRNARHALGVHVTITQHQERAIDRLRAMIAEKEEATRSMQVAAEERLDVIRHLEAEFKTVHASSEERLGLTPLRAALEMQGEALDDQSRAAVERLNLIERLNAELQAVAEKCRLVNEEAEAQRFAAAERLELVTQLERALRSKDEELASLQQTAEEQCRLVNEEAEAQRFAAADRLELVTQLERALRSKDEELASLQQTAQERLAVITELDAVGRERLEVIRSLNARLNAID